MRSESPTGTETRAELGRAAAAAATNSGCVVALFHLERVATTARGNRVRVVDREPGLLNRVHVVDLRTIQVRSAERIDDHLHAVCLELDVALDRSTVEAEPVLEPRAAASLDGNAEDADVRLLGHQLLDLLRRRRRDRQQGSGLDAFPKLHRNSIVPQAPALRIPRLC